MRKVTDPDILAQLEGKRVTDPAILAQLNAEDGQQPEGIDLFEEFGIEPPRPKSPGFRGISEDIAESLSDAPSNIWEGFKEMISQAPEAGKQVVAHPVRALENVGAGLAQGAKGAFNLPLNIAEYLGEKDIGLPFGPEWAQHYFRDVAAPLAGKIKIGDTGLQEKVLGAPQPGDELIQSLSAFAPYAKLGGFQRGVRGAGRRATAAGAFGAGQEQDPLTAALMGLAGEGVATGVGKGIQKARPSRWLKTPLSPEELEEALRITEGTTTGLGDVIESPLLKRGLENVFTKIPFSKAVETMQGTAEQVTTKGKSILEDMIQGKEPANLGVALQDALKDAYREAEKVKSKKFQKVNELADTHNVYTDRSNLRQEARKVLSQIQSDPDLAAFRAAGDMDLLQKIAYPESRNETPVSMATGKPLVPDKFSLRDSDYLRAELGERRHDAYENGDKTKAALYKRLQEAVEKDIDEAIQNSDASALKKARKEAMEHYKTEFAPFEDPEIVRYTRRGGDPDTLMQHFLRRSPISDRANLLDSLMSKLPKDKRELVPYAYYSRAIENGELNPLKMKALHKALGKNQKEVLLFDDELKRKLNDYAKLVQKNNESLKLMFNPPTGQRVSEIVGLGAALSHPYLFLAPAIARPGTWMLTSPKLRELLVRKMIEGKKAPEKESARSVALAQALMAAQAANQPNDREDSWRR